MGNHSALPHVVVIGAGFAGLRAARLLAKEKVRLTVIDRRSYHMFTPLLYQVATSSLSPSEIAVPIRSQFQGRANVQCIMAEVDAVDLDSQKVTFRDGGEVSYDKLIIAAGAQSHYFGNEAQWSPHVQTLDDLASAEKLRDRLLLAFEAAEREMDDRARCAKLTFCIIGGGPSGVELAGAIADLGRRILASDYQRVRPSDVRVVLFEASDRLLDPFAPKLSEYTKRQLEHLGVEVRLNEMVKRVEPGKVCTDGEIVECALTCWGSGVKPARVAEAIQSEKSKGRLVVKDDCSLPQHSNVFALGDIASFTVNGKPLPGLAPVALQQGEYIAKLIRDELRGKTRRPFTYKDKGMMATIGRSRAVVQTAKLQLRGFVAWIAWLLLHAWYLIGFRSKLLVLWEWAWAYIGNTHGARLVEAERAPTEEHHVDRPMGVRQQGPAPDSAADALYADDPSALEGREVHTNRTDQRGDGGLSPPPIPPAS